MTNDEMCSPPAIDASRPFTDWVAWARAVVDHETARHVPRQVDAGWAARLVGFDAGGIDPAILQRTLAQPVWEFLDRGGKRWRPLSLALACAAVGGKTETVVPFMILPEFLHNGTLIVDDVEDGSAERRHRPAAHLLHGTDVALNAGNFLYFLPFVLLDRIVAETGHEGLALSLHRRLATAMLRIHLGQALDIGWHRRVRPGGQGGWQAPAETLLAVGEADYLRMCALKTGTLAGVSMAIGALVGGAAEALADALEAFGEAIGIAFQVRDDVLNLTGAERLGKAFGDDIGEGKLSLPVIYALERAEPADRRRLLDILRADSVTTATVEEAIRLVCRTGADGRARDRAASLVGEAWAAVRDRLPAGPGRDRLADLAEFTVARGH